MKMVLCSMVVFALGACVVSVADAKSKGKDRNWAKQECLKNDPSLKGKKLKACIKGQLH